MKIKSHSNLTVIFALDNLCKTCLSCLLYGNSLYVIKNTAVTIT